MKILTSYFYQIRFMKPHMIPISTARWDPKWFHNNKNQNYVWKDKNGVYNGLRADIFAPGPLCEGLCYGKEECDTHDPSTCQFLQVYRYQLNNLDCADVVRRCERLANKIKNLENFEQEPIVVLIVHEATDNPCSERRVIQEWFADNGYTVEEFQPARI